MWLKRNFYKVPFRYFFLFIYHFLFQGAFRAGRAGYIWARLRADVMRLVDYKHYEMKIKNTELIGIFLLVLSILIIIFNKI